MRFLTKYSALALAVSLSACTATLPQDRTLGKHANFDPDCRFEQAKPDYTSPSYAQWQDNKSNCDKKYR